MHRLATSASAELSLFLNVDNGSQVLGIGLDRRQNERRKYGREQSGIVNVRARKRDYNGQAETEAKKVGPPRLNESDPLLDVPAHVAEFIFESVQRVQEGQMYVTHHLVEPINGYQVHERALHQKNELECAAEHGVRDHLS